MSDITFQIRYQKLFNGLTDNKHVINDKILLKKKRGFIGNVCVFFVQAFSLGLINPNRSFRVGKVCQAIFDDCHRNRVQMQNGAAEKAVLDVLNKLERQYPKKFYSVFHLYICAVKGLVDPKPFPSAFQLPPLPSFITPPGPGTPPPSGTPPTSSGAPQPSGPGTPPPSGNPPTSSGAPPASGTPTSGSGAPPPPPALGGPPPGPPPPPPKGYVSKASLAYQASKQTPNGSQNPAGAGAPGPKPKAPGSNSGLGSIAALAAKGKGSLKSITIPTSPKASAPTMPAGLSPKQMAAWISANTPPASPTKPAPSKGKK